MDPLSTSVCIDRPREQVFEYLLDIANHPEFSDHYLVDWHLTRRESYGRGAGARFRLKTRRNRFGWADLTLTEVDPPRRIVAAGRGGKFNRVRLLTVFSLQPGAGGTTQVEMITETFPATRADRITESLGMRRWLRRNAGRAMRRLRSILEEGAERGQRATVAG
ncbi:MAG: SRPBCC family protein [Actinobacteria bacterium]|nr:MAG: SRPBCC family protein [Actinomycetota bacterium]